MKRFFYATLMLVCLAIYSCSKKGHPSAAATTAGNDTAAVKKIVKHHLREPIPKVISVSDSGARKTVDGRYYYDLQGHRYWRNNKDGKYYLFDKSMYTNDDFKPVAN